MNTATLVTSIRILLAPVFFFVFIGTFHDGQVAVNGIIALWVVFTVMECSDFIDGRIARRTGSVTDLGKVFDPFADSFARLTYFLAFLVAGIMPAWIFLVILYRDLGVSFIRLLFMGKGIAMGAKVSDKIKAGVYAVAGVVTMAYATFIAVGKAAPWAPEATSLSGTLSQVSYLACVAAALWTMIDYAVAYRRHVAKS